MAENKVLQDLMEAFAGESQASRKYWAYAKKAEAEGRKNAAKLFRAASEAETLHAQRHLKVAGKLLSTAENLQDAVKGETYEFESMYPEFIKAAEEAGDKEAIKTYTYAMEAEKVHAKLYKEALENIDEKEEVFYYLCPVCGNIEKSTPEKCHICNTPGSKFIKY
ncbi:MAG: rubrerythrin family protein [Caldicoprobacterales bacterium]|jgi:rubrerythrin